MKLGKRVCKTADGRHVLEGDPAAAFLAYSQHREVPDAVVAELGLKRAEEPADKMTPKPEDKSHAPTEDKQPSAREVREWARSEGLDVPDRGKLPAEVVELYNETRGEVSGGSN